MKTDITVKVCIKRFSRPDPEILVFTPEEYFDPNEDEPLDVDSVPQYADFLDYLANSDDVYYQSVVIENPRNGRKLQLETNYYDQQKSLFSIVTEYRNQQVIYRELITDLLIPAYEKDAVEAHDITRFSQKNGEGEYRCIMHSIVTDYPDHTESDRELPHQPV